MSGQQLAIALLCLGAIALSATGYLGSPWPGVALCGLSLFSWAWDTWTGRTKGADAERFERIDASIREGQDRARVLEVGLKEHGEQINSLRNAASLRGTLGG